MSTHPFRIIKPEAGGVGLKTRKLELGTKNLVGARVTQARLARESRDWALSRGEYLSGLLLAALLGGILLSQHNIRYLLALMERVRAAIAQGRYEQFYRDWMDSPAANDF